MWTKSKTDSDDPIRVMPNTEHELPILKKVRSDKDEPKWAMSNTEILEPILVAPYTDKDDPRRVYILNESDDPR